MATLCWVLHSSTISQLSPCFYGGGRRDSSTSASLPARVSFESLNTSRWEIIGERRARPRFSQETAVWNDRIVNPRLRRTMEKETELMWEMDSWKCERNRDILRPAGITLWARVVRDRKLKFSSLPLRYTRWSIIRRNFAEFWETEITTLRWLEVWELPGYIHFQG